MDKAILSDGDEL